jgi:hypothetical protein
VIGSNEIFLFAEIKFIISKKNLMKDKIINIMMKLIRLTPDSVRYYIGHEILFKSRGKHIVKIILDMSKSGKSIKIDHPDLQNSLQIVSREVYVILDSDKYN